MWKEDCFELLLARVLISSPAAAALVTRADPRSSDEGQPAMLVDNQSTRARPPPWPLRRSRRRPPDRRYIYIRVVSIHVLLLY